VIPCDTFVFAGREQTTANPFLFGPVAMVVSGVTTDAAVIAMGLLLVGTREWPPGARISGKSGRRA